MFTTAETFTKNCDCGFFLSTTTLNTVRSLGDPNKVPSAPNFDDIHEYSVENQQQDELDITEIPNQEHISYSKM